MTTPAHNITIADLTRARTSTTETATWKRLRSGEWGVVYPTEGVGPGDRITIKTRDGRTQCATINRVIWHGNGVSLCEVVAVCDADAAARPTAAKRPRRGLRVCPHPGRPPRPRGTRVCRSRGVLIGDFGGG